MKENKRRMCTIALKVLQVRQERMYNFGSSRICVILLGELKFLKNLKRQIFCMFSSKNYTSKINIVFMKLKKRKGVCAQLNMIFYRFAKTRRIVIIYLPHITFRQLIVS